MQKSYNHPYIDFLLTKADGLDLIYAYLQKTKYTRLEIEFNPRPVNSFLEQKEYTEHMTITKFSWKKIKLKSRYERYVKINELTNKRILELSTINKIVSLWSYNYNKTGTLIYDSRKCQYVEQIIFYYLVQPFDYVFSSNHDDIILRKIPVNNSKKMHGIEGRFYFWGEENGPLLFRYWIEGKQVTRDNYLREVLLPVIYEKTCLLHELQNIIIEYGFEC